MDNLTVDGWYKVPGVENPIPLEEIRSLLASC